MVRRYNPVKYDYEHCNISGCSICGIDSTSHKIHRAVLGVKCVRDEGIGFLKDAIKRNDIYSVIVIYADCIGKIECALETFAAHPTLYDDTLVRFSKEYAPIALRLKRELYRMIDVYRDAKQELV